MQVLTYVDGIITVINGDDYFNGIHEKPSFITGNSFYYEPTLKQMDGVSLDNNLVIEAENFINNYVFKTDTLYVADVTNEFKKYVDIYGNYIFTNDPKENYVEIDIEPSLENDISIYDFNNNIFFKAITINKKDNTVFGLVRINEYNENEYYYGDISNYNEEICNNCQIYNTLTKSFELNIPLIKEKKSALLNKECLDYIKEQNAGVNNKATIISDSWYRQEDEARAFKLDNTKPTPCIDQILLGRNSKLTELSLPNETKEYLINKIIEKADNYNILHDRAIGRLAIILRLLDEASDYETIKNISW